MSLDFDAIAKGFGVEEIPEEVKQEIEEMSKPENMLKMYFYAAVKTLGNNNVLTFKLDPKMTIPSHFMFGYNTTPGGEYAIITVFEGEALEAINDSSNGESTAERTDVREVGDGEDPHSTDVSEPSAD